MIHIFKKTLLCSILAIFTASCSSNLETETKSDEDSQVVSNEQSEQPNSTDKQESIDKPKEESVISMPLEDYIDINSYSDLSYLTPLFLAQTTREMSDEDRLSLMSAEYHVEQDQFKKSDLGKSILPEINEEISKYAGDFGVKIPFGSVWDSSNPYYNSYAKQRETNENFYTDSIEMTLLPYDFEKKQFRIFQCVNGQAGTFTPRRNSNFTIRNDQGIELHFASLAPNEASYSTKEVVADIYQYRYKNLSCALDMEDQSKAREIEGLRSNNELDTKGYFYYKITANENVLIAQPTYAKFTLFNKNNGEELATKEFTWDGEDRF